MRRSLTLLAVFLLLAPTVLAEPPRLDRPLFGVAYYDEYMPYDRLAEDVRMMQDAGINVVRVAESTWSTLEPQDGTFDFTHVDRVLDAMHAAGIKVIVDELRTRLPDAKIFLLAILPTGRNPDDALRRLNEEVNRMIARYADNDGIVFCDIGKAFLDQNGILSNSIMPDFLHPNDRGYRIFAEALKACMDR